MARSESLESRLGALAASGANLTLVPPDGAPRRIGADPGRARVVLHSNAALDALRRGDHLALAEGYLFGALDIEGDLLEVMKVTELLVLDATPLQRLAIATRLLLHRRTRVERESIAAHYDRPPEFFLPWLGRWRCYSHALFESEDEDLDVAMERKLEAAFRALGLEPGMHVFDMGGGWGCFLEYAGLRGVHVHAITISEAQHGFVRDLIREKSLPCSIEFANFREYVPARPFDAAVFMGTFEHYPHYSRAARFVARHVKPEGRVWADFCAQRSDFQPGGFMLKYIWPAPVRYVNPHALLRAFQQAGFNFHELADDTLSYARTVRVWADRLDTHAKDLAGRYGEPTLRAFRLYLRGSQHFLERNRTQAYHLLASQTPRRGRTLT